MKHLLFLFWHDLRFQARQTAAWATLVLFFMIVIMLLPFTLGPEPDLLRRLAPGLVWLATLLMSLLALEKLFVQDARDGTLDLMLLAPHPLPLIVLGKLIAQGVMILGVLLVMLLPATLLLGMDVAVLPVLALTLILGVPILVLLGGLITAMTVTLHRNLALLTLLLVPLYIPVLIFAVAACDARSLGTDPTPPLLLLGALFVVLCPVAPFVIASTLRQGQG